MQRPSFAEMECSIAQSLEVVGEWWSLMIVRELFFGRNRFEEIHDNLGIARNTLTTRLNRLVEEGVLERRVHAGTRRRTEYHLTRAGGDLYHVLIALIEWGAKWRPLPGGPTTLMVHSCGQVTAPVLTCDRCGEPVKPSNLRLQPSSAE